jgi:hypothetical protein
MLTQLVLSAAACLPGPTGEELPDFNAVEWWNSIPLTLEQLRGRAVFVEVFRTW